jgi:cardiolipin synthase (CMP-forming)
MEPPLPPKRRLPGRRNASMSLADWLTSARLLLVVVLWPVALAGAGLLVGLGLIAAGVTDALDGYVARRTGRQSLRGAHLDAVADIALMLSGAAWLELLHPQIAADNGPILAATGILYGLSQLAGGVDPRQVSGKVAGGLLYLFALFTLLTGMDEAPLLDAALLALAVASLETIFKATRTIHATDRASKTRSQAPQALKGVSRSTAAAASMVTSATPSASDTRP